MAAALQQQQLRSLVAGQPLPCRIHAGPARRHRQLQVSQSCAQQSHKQLLRAPRQQLQAQAKRQDWQSSSSRSGGRSRRSDKSFRFKLNDIDVALAEDQMWKMLIPFAAIFGLAIFIGPLVVGITISAIAVGAAFSAGALAFTTLLLPLIVLSGVGGLMSIGVMAALGAAIAIPKMIFSVMSLAFVGGGLALGWGGVNWLLSQQSSATKFPARAESAESGSRDDDERKVVVEDDAYVKRAASELRQFDELLARSEEKRRVEEWQQQRRRGL